MPTHVQNLVIDILARILVETLDVILETLPLSLLVARIEGTIGVVCSIDQAKVDFGLFNVSTLIR